MTRQTWMGVAMVALSACDGTSPPADTPDSGSANEDGTIALNAMGCLDVDGHTYTPFALEGRLVVTYYEPTIQERLCDWDDETSQYWCPSPTQIAPDCADEDGTFWCPTANPSADRLGDAQELGIFDLRNPSAGVTRWTTNTEHEAELDVSPDGTKVVYAVRDKADAFDLGRGIWIRDIDGGNPRQVVSQSGHTGIPTWNGNDRFTFIADSFHQFDVTTGMVSTIAVTGFDSYLIDPEASHDGTMITFKADLEENNRPTVHVMDFDGTTGSNVRQLTRGYSDHDPVFSIDNRKIYFERFYGTVEWDAYHMLDRTDTPDLNKWGIVEVDVATGSERVLVPHDPCGKHFWWLPTISPDGQHIMFIHDYVADDGYQDFWVSDLDGRNAQPVEGTRGFHWFDWTE